MIFRFRSYNFSSLMLFYSYQILFIWFLSSREFAITKMNLSPSQPDSFLETAIFFNQGVYNICNIKIADYLVLNSWVTIIYPKSMHYRRLVVDLISAAESKGDSTMERRQIDDCTGG